MNDLVGVLAVIIAGVANPAFGSADRPPAAPLPAPRGTVTEASGLDWARIVIPATGCTVINNVWNKAASDGKLNQEIFVERLNGRASPGWRWTLPPRIVPTVVSQPQIVCGDKPWDAPGHLRPDFPLRAGSRAIRADFKAAMRASGVYNLAFTMWAASSARPEKADITHEIMIWIANNGQIPAGRRRGSVDVNGTSYAVWVREQHGDASGANANVWKYVAFVAQTPVLVGPLDLDRFLEYLMKTGLITDSHFVTSVELGNELSWGSGIVELEGFSVTTGALGRSSARSCPLDLWGNVLCEREQRLRGDHNLPYVENSK